MKKLSFKWLLVVAGVALSVLDAVQRALGWTWWWARSLAPSVLNQA